MTITQVRRHRQKWIDRYKVAKGCAKCGWRKHPCALVFDHRRGTEKHPATKNGCPGEPNGGGFSNLYHPKYSVRVLMDEIRKCRILCSRCHMIKTYPDHPMYKQKPIPGMSRRAVVPKSRRGIKPALDQMTLWEC